MAKKAAIEERRSESERQAPGAPADTRMRLESGGSGIAGRAQAFHISNAENQGNRLTAEQGLSKMSELDDGRQSWNKTMV